MPNDLECVVAQLLVSLHRNPKCVSLNPTDDDGEVILFLSAIYHHYGNFFDGGGIDL